MKSRLGSACGTTRPDLPYYGVFLAHDPTQLPPDLPVPWDDGACDHLGRGAFERLPAIELPSTNGGLVNLGALACGPEAGTATGVVLFFYPRTGVPGQAPSLGYAGEDWDTIPGARGCTPQSCSFRDHFAEFQGLGVTVFGVSTNTTEHQREFRTRQNIPFEFLSDCSLEFVRALRLPTFEFPVESGGPGTLIRRMAIFAEHGRIAKVWYPVFPPNENAARVLFWLKSRRAVEATSLGGSLPSSPPDIRPIEPRDLTWVREELARNWGATQISSLGRWYDADALPGFIATARDGVERIGLLTHTPPESGVGCEVITLSSCVEGSGVGSTLLAAAVRKAREAGCTRVYLTTTNDNLRAIGFYQKRGWRIAAVHREAMDRARAVKPQIPLLGHHGIPLRDEIELEMRLDRRPSHDEPTEIQR